MKDKLVIFEAVCEAIEKITGEKSVALEDNIRELGFDSLDSTYFINEIEEKLDIELDDDATEGCITVSDFVNRVYDLID